jgi:hypothetical protein
MFLLLKFAQCQCKSCQVTQTVVTAYISVIIPYRCQSNVGKQCTDILLKLGGVETKGLQLMDLLSFACYLLLIG